MNNDILDDLTSKNEVTFIPTAFNWSSIILLWIGIFFCFNEGIILNIKVIIGILLLLGATIISLYNFKLGIKVTLAIIVLGVVHLVTFYPYEFSFGFSIGETKVGLE